MVAVITALSCHTHTHGCSWAQVLLHLQPTTLGGGLTSSPQLAAGSQHSQDLIVANRQMGLTKARVQGAEGWPHDLLHLWEKYIT